MASATIKKEFEQTVIAFGNSGLPLGLRSEEDINSLAVIAQQSNNKQLLNMFETLPAIEELQQSKTENDLADIRPAIEKIQAETKAKLKPGASSQIVPVVEAKQPTENVDDLKAKE
jgi:tRNA A37 threonylcarbamoyladenosine synthetase subunit TsaC/SUA5/YrdC